MATLSACGSGSNIYDYHSKKAVTFRNVSSVISGSVVTPPGVIISKIEIFSAGNFLRIATPAKCQPDLISFPGSTPVPVLEPAEVVCQDNNFYFSKVRYPANVQFPLSLGIRVTSNQGTFFEGVHTVTLEEALLAARTRSDIVMTAYDDWKGQDGTTLAVFNPNVFNSNSNIVINCRFWPSCAL
jgi:hypothetical protein